MKTIIIFASMFALVCMESENKSKSDKKKLTWKEKDMRDMTEGDLEKLLDQWEENDEPLEPDELPEYLRPSPQIDLSKIDTTNPDNLLRATKKGKGVMMFVDCKSEISEEQAEITMRIWQTSLQNNHIISERYPIGPNRAVFMFREGSQAVDAKNYFIEQPELSEITFEGQTFYGKHTKRRAAQTITEEQRRSKKKVEL